MLDHERACKPRSIPFHQVRILLPYAPPMVLVDRVCDWHEDGSIWVEKVISGADPFTSGHFPDGPAIAPGIMLIELVAQAGVILGRLLAMQDDAGVGRVGVTSRVNAHYFAPVYVGDTVLAQISREMLPLDKCILRGELSVRGQRVAKVILFAALL